MRLYALLLSCAPEPAPAPEAGEVCPEDLSVPTAGELPQTVLLLSIDTVNRELLGVHQSEWETTPNIDSLFAEGVRFDRVLVPRALSAPSMATMITGMYPAVHGVRANEAPAWGTGISPVLPLLYHRFEEEGYSTWGWLANMCFLLDGSPSIQHRACQWTGELDVDQDVADATLTDDAAATLAALDPEERFFGWVHLIDPHDPYGVREPWYSQFHPQIYTGELVPTEAQLAEIAHGERAYSEEDRRHVEAAYASQLRAADVHVGELMAALSASGRLEDAVILVAFDHGDELAQRTGYFFHGCSPYNGALATTWAIRAPGRAPAGMVLGNWVSSVDMVPTLLELVGLEPDAMDGVSLAPEIATCTEPDRAALFERGVETAGVVRGGWKYILSPRGGYAECIHYSAEDPFPGEVEELYDLSVDPLELDDRTFDRPDVVDALRTEVCAWVNATSWSEYRENLLVEACAP